MHTYRGLVRRALLAANDQACATTRKSRRVRPSRESRRGFTLIEILIVIGLIAILAAVVLIAINPARQFALGRDSQRVSNINAIINAVGQRMADNKGQFAGTFTDAGGTTYTCGPIPSTASTSILTTMYGGSAITGGELGCLVPTYIPALPTDPSATGGSDTGYTIRSDSAGRIWVSAPKTEPTIPRMSDLSVVR